ncbi:hypothetical protein GCM10011581_25930 [Saccharopolyspora subtropica]|uniref:Uncharacterized protein n=1 Tax=Saccharopolyspora thermophila TaxID=89367 RepID=A0A917JWQ4_9PSEU|nr:hypothetical protein GCM10011581_25930 [Saccharopolyspora subtropica]
MPQWSRVTRDGLTAVLTQDGSDVAVCIGGHRRGLPTSILAPVPPVQARRRHAAGTGLASITRRRFPPPTGTEISGVIVVTVRKLVSANGVEHWVIPNASTALCGVPLVSLTLPDPLRTYVPCTGCPGKLAARETTA